MTVDVTGTWYGIGRGSGSSFPTDDVWLELDQQGSTVKGVIRTRTGAGLLTGPIDGTVAGDVFRFSTTRGGAEGELTVGGDEMMGEMSWAASGHRQITLRRVESSSRPGPPTR